ncbi:hypothetical protein FGADI_6305 [Fusarium gaditjirri]|uniref:Uncharacterized protein n=1 Tax=Fusarium gaditjirri TaxID=282569 RepID=A0A8H4T7Z1_9HYPO|nr:hypothetical protein FGADI_6305 [Fusarium gaditjirri]
MGILTYRDVLHGVLPETLAEVFSFACLSFVISTLLCRKGRIRRDQILAGLHQWRDSIYDEDEKLTLDTLASAMWPVGVNGDYYQSAEQCPNEDIEPINSASRNLDCFSINDPRTFSDPKKASEAPSQTEDLPSIGVDSFSAPFNTGVMGGLEQDACSLLGISHEEFNFAQLCNTEADSNIFGSQSFPSRQDQPGFIDPRDLTKSRSAPILRYPDSLLYSPLSFPTYAPLPTEYPFRDLLSNADTSQPEIKLHILEKTSDHPTFTLKNTPMFLVVLAFGKENGTVFFSFSGSGQTVVCERRGSLNPNKKRFCGKSSSSL